MGGTSKDLLLLEHKDCSTTAIESALHVCNRKHPNTESKKPNPDKKFIWDPAPESQVLGRVKDFLGVISEDNKRLQLDAKDNSQDYDIEALTGNETEVIEMDLMLGIADLHTPEAISAAESAIACNQPVIPLPVSSSETETEDSDDDDNENSDSDVDDEDHKTLDPMNLKRSKTSKDNSLSEAARKNQSRPKIVELS